MYKKNLTTVFLITAFSCIAQNKRTPDGLRTGEWSQKFPSGYGRVIGKVTTEGAYTIIPANTYEIIRKLGNDSYEVKYKRSTPLLFHAGIKNGSMSVKDGVWNVYDSSGRLAKTDVWSNGLNTNSKYFDDKGNLVQCHYVDYDNDTSFYLTNIDKQLFKKAYYPPENKNSQVKIYYPENDLIINYAELGFRINFLYKPSDTQYVILSSAKETSIYSVTSANNSVEISGSFTAGCYPMKVTPETPAILQLIAKPHPLMYKRFDTIFIKTSEDRPTYKIYCETHASHIDNRNVEIIKEIQLSRTKDRYLIIPSLGTVTDAVIKSQVGGSKGYEINGIRKIDLSQFSPGTYMLEISSCHTGGEMKLIITD
jgi:hypothetical protein